MPVHNIFPTPVYAKQLRGSKQGEINQELYSVYKPTLAQCMPRDAINIFLFFFPLFCAFEKFKNLKLKL